MKLKMLGLAAMGALILTAAASSGASATTLEVGGAPATLPLTITASVPPGKLLLLTNTSGSLGTGNMCAQSHAHGTATTSANEGRVVTGPLSFLTFGECHIEGVTVHKPGKLYLEHITGTTNAEVFSEEAEVTVPTTLGLTVNCKTGTGATIGTLTGVKTGHATLDVNAVLSCGFVMPTALLNGTYEVTSPTGLGVSA
ncbi:MAG TPA: hypothetical protein VGK41_01930 [Solirubrobacterales bacterium]